MAAVLSQQRCLHHPIREAVARCPECTQFFCRECITEHDDRVICSPCLRRITLATEKKSRRTGVLLRPLQLACGIVFAWLFFYCVGRVLVSIPTSFHEGTVWLGGGFDSSE